MFKRKIISVVMSILALGLTQAMGHGDGISLAKGLTAKRAVSVNIDGKLNEDAWREADSKTDFLLIGGTTSSKGTTVKALYDDERLYFGFSCDNPDMARLKPIARERDGGVSTDEAVEIFLDPNTRGKAYYQLMLSYANIQEDKKIVDLDKKDTFWNMPWQSATDIRKDGWTAEIAIPLYLIADAKGLNGMTFNIFRDKRRVELDPVGANVIREFKDTYTLCELKNGTDVSKYMPLRMESPETLNIKTPCLITIVDIVPGKLTLDEKGARCEVTVKLDKAGNAGKVTVELLNKDNAQRASREISFKEGSVKEDVALSIPIGQATENNVTVTIRDPRTGQSIQSREFTFSKELISGYFDRNYYTTEQNAILRMTLNLSESQRNRVTITVESENQLLAEVKPSSEDFPIILPVDKIPMGNHLIVVKVALDSKVSRSASFPIVRLEPKPGHEWKIDHERRVLLDNGKPFFAMGVVPEAIASTEEEYIKDIADIGCNTFFLWDFRPGKTSRHALDTQEMAAKHGLYVMQNLECYIRDDADSSVWHKYLPKEVAEKYKRKYKGLALTVGLKPFLAWAIPDDLKKLSAEAKKDIYESYYQANRDSMLQGVEQTKESKNLIGYFIADEPCKISFFDMFTAARDLNESIKKIDMYHPTFANYNGYVWEGKIYSTWYDILMNDPYWLPGADGVYGTPNYVTKFTRLSVARVKEERKPFWSVPCLEYWSAMRKRPLTPEELRVQSYLAVIHGATGLFYFVYPAAAQSSVDTLKAIFSEVKKLEPAIFSLPTNLKIEYFEGSKAGKQVTWTKTELNPDKDIFPSIQIAAKKMSDTEYAIIAANSQPYPVNVSIAVPGLSGASDYLAETPVRLINNCLSATFEKYGTKTYKITMATAPQATETIQVKAISAVDNYIRETTCNYPYIFRDNKKNLFANPSFEDSTGIKGWPDYVMTPYRKRFEPSKRIGSANPKWGQDFKEVFHGKASLKCVNINEEKAYNPCFDIWLYCSPQNDAETQYTYSIYLKSDKDGAKVQLFAPLMLPYPIAKEIKLTKEWKRYELTGALPPKAKENFLLVRLYDKAIMWCDAAQFEKGDKATEFEE